MIQTDLNLWYKEGLFSRHRFSKKELSISVQMKYINFLRNIYFATPMESFWNFDGTSKIRGIPRIEIIAFQKARVYRGFDYIHNKDMREFMRQEILKETLEKSIKNKAEKAGFGWKNFKFDFAYGLFEMINAKVGKNEI